MNGHYITNIPTGYYLTSKPRKDYDYYAAKIITITATLQLITSPCLFILGAHYNIPAMMLAATLLAILATTNLQAVPLFTNGKTNWYNNFFKP